MTVYMYLYAYNIESQEYFVSDEQSMTPNSIIQRNVIVGHVSVVVLYCLWRKGELAVL